MKSLAPFFLYLISLLCNNQFAVAQVSQPIVITTDSCRSMLGEFTDDYGIRYNITDSVWAQGPVIKYHILQWNKKEQYCIARNGRENPTEAGLYTRIDYMQFNEMKPWLWGFCYTVYNAASESDAVKFSTADRSSPRKGCNGFPFSRMKPVE